MPQNTKSGYVEETVKEFPSICKQNESEYKITVRKRKEGAIPPYVLDIREYVTAEKYTGYTRRGIRVSKVSDMESLQAALEELKESDWFK